MEKLIPAIKEQIRELNQRIATESERATMLTRIKNLDKARQCLIQRRQLLKRVSRLEQRLMGLQDQRDRLECTKIDMQTVEALRALSDDMFNILGQHCLDNVDNVFADVEEKNGMAQDLQDMMSDTRFFPDFMTADDEDALEKELAEYLADDTRNKKEANKELAKKTTQELALPSIPESEPEEHVTEPETANAASDTTNSNRSVSTQRITAAGFTAD